MGRGNMHAFRFHDKSMLSCERGYFYNDHPVHRDTNITIQSNQKRPCYNSHFTCTINIALSSDTYI